MWLVSMLTSHMSFVCNHTSSLDLEISPVQAQRCAETYLERNKTVQGSYAPRIRRAGPGAIPASVVDN